MKNKLMDAIDFIEAWYKQALKSDHVFPQETADQFRLELEGLLVSAMYILRRQRDYKEVQEYAEDVYSDFEEEVRYYVNIQTA